MKNNSHKIVIFNTFSSGLGSGFRTSFGPVACPAELCLTGVFDVTESRFSARTLWGCGRNSISQRAHVVRPRNQRRINLQTARAIHYVKQLKDKQDRESTEQHNSHHAAQMLQAW